MKFSSEAISESARRWTRTLLDQFNVCRTVLGCDSADCLFGPPEHQQPVGPCTCLDGLSTYDAQRLGRIAERL